MTVIAELVAMEIIDISNIDTQGRQKRHRVQKPGSSWRREREPLCRFTTASAARFLWSEDPALHVH